MNPKELDEDFIKRALENRVDVILNHIEERNWDAFKGCYYDFVDNLDLGIENHILNEFQRKKYERYYDIFSGIFYSKDEEEIEKHILRLKNRYELDKEPKNETKIGNITWEVICVIGTIGVAIGWVLNYVIKLYLISIL